MGDASMPLSDEDVRRIGDYVKPYLKEMVLDFAPRVGETAAVGERLVELTAELKAQRELMSARFAASDKRFDDLIEQTNQRFTAVDRRIDDSIKQSNQRFDDLIEQTNQRFTAVDRRIDDSIKQSNQRFDDLIEQTNQRFDDLLAHSDRRFASLERRFEDVHRSIGRAQWAIGIGFVIVTALVTVFGVLS